MIVKIGNLFYTCDSNYFIIDSFETIEDAMMSLWEDD